MSLHQQINAEIARQYEALCDAEVISPTALAVRAQAAFLSGEETPQIEYASLEQFKHWARVFLAKRKDPDADESEAYQGQLDLGISFSGQLQDRYPLPRKAGDEPLYKLRHMLTQDERAWNVTQLRKSAMARMEHADALEAEGQVSRVA